jgi:hypothetical protein
MAAWRVARGLVVVVALIVAMPILTTSNHALAQPAPRVGEPCAKANLNKSSVGANGTLPPTTVAVRSGAVLFKEDFAGFGGKWPTVQNANGSAGYRDEKFRITVTQPSSAVGVRAPIEAETNITVEADASVVSPTGQIGIGCVDSGSLDVPTRIIATVDRTDRWSITEVRAGVVRVLASGDMPLGAIYAGDLPNHMLLSCTGTTGGTGRVALVLNGQGIGAAAIGVMPPSGSVSLWATSFATPTLNGTTSVDTLWNDVIIRRA